MFDLDGVDLESLIEAIDRSGVSEFSVITADGELRVSKAPMAGSRPATGGQQPHGARVPVPESPAVDAVEGRDDEVEPIASVAAGSGDLEVRTPLLGVFYRAPKPGAPAFVEVGDRVEPDMTVALVEAMKVFTAIPAGVAGLVTEVLVSDRELVEYDQVLFRVAPDDAARAR